MNETIGTVGSQPTTTGSTIVPCLVVELFHIVRLHWHFVDPCWHQMIVSISHSVASVGSLCGLETLLHVVIMLTKMCNHFL